MSNKNRLAEIPYEILITEQLTSISIIEARNLMLAKYAHKYTSKELYKHIYQQLKKLQAYGYVDVKIDSINQVLIFEVTANFMPQNFLCANTTKIYDKRLLTDKKQGLINNIEQNLLKIEEDIFNLTIEKEEIEKVINGHSRYEKYVENLYNDVVHLLKVNFARYNALNKILSHV